MGVAKNLLTKNKTLIEEQGKRISLNDLRHILRNSNPNCCPAGNTWIFTMEDRVVLIHDGKEEWELIISGANARKDPAHFVIEQNFSSQHPEFIMASDILPTGRSINAKDFIICDDTVLFDRTAKAEGRYVRTCDLYHFSAARFGDVNAYTKLINMGKTSMDYWYYLTIPFSRGEKSCIFKIEHCVDRRQGKDFYFSRYTPESILRSIFNTFHHPSIKSYQMPIRTELSKAQEHETKVETAIVRDAKQKKIMPYLSNETMNSIMAWFNSTCEGMDPIEYERRERRMFRTHVNAVLSGLARSTYVGIRNEKVYEMYLRSAEKQAADEAARIEHEQEIRRQYKLAAQLEADRQEKEKLKMRAAAAKKRQQEEENARRRQYNIPIGAIIVQDREMRYAFDETKYWPIKARFFDDSLESLNSIFAKDSVVHIDVDTESLIVVRELNIAEGFAHVIMVRQYNSNAQNSGILSPYRTSRLWRVDRDRDILNVNGFDSAYRYHIPVTGLSSKSTNRDGVLEFIRMKGPWMFRYTWIAIETVIPYKDLIGSSKIPSESNYAALIYKNFWYDIIARAYIYPDYASGNTTSKYENAVGIVKYDLGDLMSYNGVTYHRTWSNIKYVETEIYLSEHDRFKKHQSDAAHNIQSLKSPAKFVL